MQYFDRKKVAITGGSSGIGRAVAEWLVQWGADLALIARRRELLENTRADLLKLALRSDQKILIYSIDVGDAKQVYEHSPKILAELGGLDILINNAGITYPQPFWNLDDQRFHDIMQVNYFGMVYMTRAFLDHFKTQKHGHIVNISSMLGFLGVYGYTAYAASKFAMVGFSECLRQELLPYHVQITVVYPPDTDTPQFHEENKVKPKETEILSGSVKLMSPSKVALALLKGVRKSKLHVVPGFDGQFVHFMTKHFGGLVRWVMDRDLKRFWKRQQH